MKKLSYLILLMLFFNSCKSPEARRPVMQKTGSFIEKSIARDKRIVAREETAIQKIIEQDSAHNYISSPNGFWYFYVEEDTTATRTPKFGEVVEFDYNVETLDGRSIYSEDELPTRTYVIDKEELFSGLREGLKIMNPGETVTFLFPSHQAFGFYGDKKRIGSNVPIKSTVTLHGISENNNSNK